jgi:segregation and condensation protein A
MEIKSRMLIPRPAANPDDPAAGSTVEDFSDPRQELVKQLLAYKAFKDAAADLRRRGQTEARRFPRAVSRPSGRAPLDIEDLNLFALIDAFNAIMSSIGHSAFGHEVVYDDTPISLHQADILDRLQREAQTALAEGQTHSLTLRDLFAGRTKKTELIGLFLAVLELMRQKRVMVEQSELLGEVHIRLRDPDDTPVIAAPPAPDQPYEVPSMDRAKLTDSPPEGDVPPAGWEESG